MARMLATNMKLQVQGSGFKGLRVQSLGSRSQMITSPYFLQGGRSLTSGSRVPIAYFQIVATISYVMMPYVIYIMW